MSITGKVRNKLAEKFGMILSKSGQITEQNQAKQPNGIRPNNRTKLITLGKSNN